MSKCDFPILPWFIQREIIDEVFAINKDCCLLNREWLHYVISRYGTYVTGSWKHHNSRSLALLEKSAEAIRFGEGQIDWDFINPLKHTKRVIIDDIEYNYQSHLILRYVLDIPQLKSLQFSGELTNLIGVKWIIQHHSNSLKELIVDIYDFSGYSLINDIVLPELINFELVSVHEPFPYDKLVTNIPKLKKLTLCTHHTNSDHILWDGIITSITELNICYHKPRSYMRCNPETKINLSKFPSLKCLACHDGLIIKNDQKSMVNELRIYLTHCSLNLESSHLFANITKLYVNILNSSAVDKLKTIIPLCNKLTFLSLDFHDTKIASWDWSTTLLSPIGVRLRMHSTVPRSLLYWLFHLFKLQWLELEVYDLEMSAIENPVQFKFLNMMIVNTAPYYEKSLRNLFEFSYPEALISFVNK